MQVARAAPKAPGESAALVRAFLDAINRHKDQSPLCPNAAPCGSTPVLLILERPVPTQSAPDQDWGFAFVRTVAANHLR